MEISPEEYTRHYIVQALFSLMAAYEYENISITDIARKAGVGRATFYRYFKRKEDVISYYFDRNVRDYIFSQRIYPRCKDDYVREVKGILELFRQHKEIFRLLKRARLEYFYLDYLNKSFNENFEYNHPQKSAYLPYIYAGMLFNVSMAWLDNDCVGSSDELAETIVNAIYFGS